MLSLFGNEAFQIFSKVNNIFLRNNKIKRGSSDYNGSNFYLNNISCKYVKYSYGDRLNRENMSSTLLALISCIEN